MGNKYVITLAFCKSALLEDFLWHCDKHALIPEGVRHVIVNRDYPVDRDENRADISSLAFLYGKELLDSEDFEKNIGLHTAFNNAVKVLGVKPGDTLIGLDPDDRPAPGTIQAMIEVMNETKDIAVLGCSFDYVFHRESQGYPYQNREVAGHRLMVHPNTDIWNVAAFNTEWLLRVGGLKQYNQYYFGLEESMLGDFMHTGMKLAYLQDYRSDVVKLDKGDPKLFDPEYGEWKLAQTKGEFPGSFGEYLTRG